MMAVGGRLSVVVVVAIVVVVVVIGGYTTSVAMVSSDKPFSSVTVSFIT